MKICTRCKTEKDVSEFSKDKRAKSGLQSRCRSCQAECDAKWYSENKEHKAEHNAKWYSENKEHRAEYDAKWVKENPEKRRAKCAKRRATKLKAVTPTTCNKTIASIYKNCPEGYHVDHIVPLAKKGKHHQDNLCYLPASLNQAKGAKILEDYPALLKEFNEQVIYPNI